MPSTAIQLFTVCELEESLPEILRRVADAGYDGVELNEEWFPLVSGRTRPDERSVSGQTPSSLPSLECTGVQIPLPVLESRFEDVCTVYERYECSDFIVPYLDDACFESESAVRKTAARLTDVADRLAERDNRLHYHNHDFEFENLGGRTAFDRLVEATDGVRYQLDVGWAAAAGGNPVDLLERYGDAIDLIHVKDMTVATKSPVELGTGDVDLKACAAAARRIDADWLIYEYDWPSDPAASIEHGATWFETHLE